MKKEDIFDTIQELELLIESIEFDYKQSDEDKILVYKVRTI